ncbi:hypothetical protein U9M48_022977 [Paspalum notatum var. saurae]|uniref:Cathepsin propeptide inhibitor domain-containing protein n=1 Tax=Paspalum notatum var. saurae TaxID=547442 RepID=A0AAQ3TKN9_PASNO
MSLRALGALISHQLGVLSTRDSPSAGPRVGVAELRCREIMGDGAFGALTVVGFEAALLYCQEDESAVALSPHKKGNMFKDPAIRAKLTDKDGKVAWMKYNDYVNLRKKYPKLAEEEVLGMVRQRAAKEKVVKTLEHEDTKVDESVMRARFDEWIKEYGRSYRSEEEKASRYEAFKVNAMRADKLNALSRSGGARYATNIYGDWTEEEFSSMFPRQDDLD